MATVGDSGYSRTEKRGDGLCLVAFFSVALSPLFLCTPQHLLNRPHKKMSTSSWGRERTSTPSPSHNSQAPRPTSATFENEISGECGTRTLVPKRKLERTFFQVCARGRAFCVSLWSFPNGPGDCGEAWMPPKSDLSRMGASSIISFRNIYKPKCCYTTGKRKTLGKEKR